MANHQVKQAWARVGDETPTNWRSGFARRRRRRGDGELVEPGIFVLHGIERVASEDLNRAKGWGCGQAPSGRSETRCRPSASPDRRRTAAR